jgi:regulator of sigma E protease
LATLTTFWYIAQVVLGLGFVIFIHELGHFVLAKWNAVKVEKFSIGFGPTLMGISRGETEYVIAAVPLGGFVKMLGEGPEDEANRSTDPRAFTNKSVGARMAIISAGVAMNVLMGLGCFVYAYGQGMIDRPAKVGAVGAGSPAYEAGMRAGDEIVAVDGKGDISFSGVTLKVRLSGKGQALHFDVKRPGHEGLLGMDIQPRRDPGVDYPTIGVLPSSSLDAVIVEVPAGAVEIPALPGDFTNLERKTFDTLVAAGPPGQAPTPLADYQAYEALLCRFPDKPLVHVFEHKEKPDAPATGRFELTLPPAHYVDFGCRFAPLPISGIQKDSLADKAGFRVGDKIVKVDGKDDFDPMRLPDICRAQAGKPMTFEVERASAAGPKTVTLVATPDDSPVGTEPVLPAEALEVPGLGLCYQVRPSIQAVRPDSPAARAGLKPGDVITSIGFPPRAKPDPARLKTPEKNTAKNASAESTSAQAEETIKLDDTSSSWVSLFRAIQFRPPGPIALGVNNGSSPVWITPEPDLTWPLTDRGLRFLDLAVKLPPLSIGAAMRRGMDDTIENIMSIYAMIRSLVQRRVGPQNLAGPVNIARIAYRAASSGLTPLIHFLGIISINLAVINFLPIPPLDGGQMLFLVAEKVRGKPLPESALIPAIYLGLLMILCLFVFVTYQDVFSIIRDWRATRP